MKNVIRLAIVDPNEATRNSLKNLLLGIDMVWFEAECSRYEYFSRCRYAIAARYCNRFS